MPFDNFTLAAIFFFLLPFSLLRIVHATDIIGIHVLFSM